MGETQQVDWCHKITILLLHITLPYITHIIHLVIAGCLGSPAGSRNTNNSLWASGYLQSSVKAFTQAVPLSHAGGLTGI